MSFFNVSFFFFNFLTGHLNILNNADGRQVLVADPVDGGHERELVAETLLGQNVVHVLRCRGSLQLLAVQHLLLELVKGLASGHVSLGHLAVAAAGAGGDEISHTAGLEEGLILDIRVKHL